MESSRTPGQVVLIVEDNSANLLLARTVLERGGYSVATAQTADEVRRYLQSATPDLILMDIGLPGQDGLSLTREIKSMSQMATIPIVAVTAHAMANDEQRARAAGCDGYVSKPFRARQLLDELAAILGPDRDQAAV